MWYTCTDFIQKIRPIGMLINDTVVNKRMNEMSLMNGIETFIEGIAIFEKLY